ncbi:MAG: class II fumarate hydratase, partial [Clostridiales Family XIII bacterium]|nr:class II fumarate hydratase [Clostridiales Family XIII bacterium]
MNYRTEKDTMGEIQVEDDKLWGAQTQRSLENFKIGWEKMPLSIIRAFAVLKKAAAFANSELGALPPASAEAIGKACDAILAGGLYDQFPLAVWQTGSGTQSNMNVNEVIAHMTKLHPNDDVNKGQSSNDTFPTAMHIAAVTETEEFLFPALTELEKTFADLAERYADIIKIGRTHLQDATPLTLGQEISAWHAMLSETKQMIRGALNPVRRLALGGTAVGTGLNAHPDFGRVAAEKISLLTGHMFITAENK